MIGTTSHVHGPRQATAIQKPATRTCPSWRWAVAKEIEGRRRVLTIASWLRSSGMRRSVHPYSDRAAIGRRGLAGW